MRLDAEGNDRYGSCGGIYRRYLDYVVPYLIRPRDNVRTIYYMHAAGTTDQDGICNLDGLKGVILSLLGDVGTVGPTARRSNDVICLLGLRWVGRWRTS